jgi:hypothetical protein
MGSIQWLAFFCAFVRHHNSWLPKRQRSILIGSAPTSLPMKHPFLELILVFILTKRILLFNLFESSEIRLFFKYFK